MKIVAFEWSNTYNRDLIIGTLRPFTEVEPNHVMVYGINLTIPENINDLRLATLSCHNTGLKSEIKEITKEEARALLIKRIDESLDIIYGSPMEAEQALIKPIIDEDSED